MAVNIVSTTDSAADVTKAQGMYAQKSVETKSAPSEKSESTKQAEASEPTAKADHVDTEVDTDSETEVEHDDSGHDESKDAGTPKKKGGFQRRIDKLNKRVSSTEEERDYWREQALKKGEIQTPKPQESTVEKTAKDMTGKPDPDKFETVADYLEAVADWKYEQRVQKAEADKKVAEAKSTYEKSISTFQEKRDEFKKSVADYDEALDSVEHIPLSVALHDFILESEHGPQLAYELAKNPDEYERVSKLSPLALYREMGKMEAKISPASTSEKTPNKITKAPAPIKPVSRGAVTSTKDPGEMSYKEYVEWRKNGGGR
jgi:uncharacterized protein YozE (UPF0346 family)